MVVLVDTGILLRLLDRADPQHPDIRAALRRLRSQGDTLVVATQNIAEFWNVCTRPPSARGGYGLSVQETERRVRVLERIFHVLPDTHGSYPIWKQLATSHAVQGVQVHDARLVALMSAHGVIRILTLNTSDFQRGTRVLWRSLPNKCLPRLDNAADLFAEAKSRRGQSPLDHDDHALDALRYLIATIDQRKLGRKAKNGGGAAGEQETPARRPWLRLDNEALWTRIWSVGR
jgi:predicted nucleic acid-binding protein